MNTIRESGAGTDLSITARLAFDVLDILSDLNEDTVLDVNDRVHELKYAEFLFDGSNSKSLFHQAIDICVYNMGINFDESEIKGPLSWLFVLSCAQLYKTSSSEICQRSCGYILTCVLLFGCYSLTDEGEQEGLFNIIRRPSFFALVDMILKENKYLFEYDGLGHIFMSLHTVVFLSEGAECVSTDILESMRSIDKDGMFEDVDSFRDVTYEHEIRVRDGWSTFCDSISLGHF